MLNIVYFSKILHSSTPFPWIGIVVFFNSISIVDKLMRDSIHTKENPVFCHTENTVTLFSCFFSENDVRSPESV